MKDSWIAQYKMVQGSRAVLLDYCDAITQAHFLAGHTGFGKGGSIRNLLVHIGQVYQYWIGEHALNREVQYPDYSDIAIVQDCRVFFAHVNTLVNEFISRFADTPDAVLTSIRNNKETSTTAFEVFTHVITHEFHHKGQVLSISRQLGYTPVDTDVIR